MNEQTKELLNIKKLKSGQQEKAIAAFDKLILETGVPDDSLQMRVLLHALDGHKVSEDVQTALRNQLAIIVEYCRHGAVIPKDFFKWDSSSSAKMINEEMFKKDYFQWGKNNGAIKTDGGPEKMKVSDYRWRK